MNSAGNILYTIFEWITRFAYVNLLWVLFSLVGGIIFGFFPSTIAMFAIVRDWLRGKPDLPIFKTYWNYFKSEFVKSNQLGIFITIMLILVGLDLFYIQANLNNLLSWTSIPLFSFILLFLLLLFYIFPTYVHYDLKVARLLKNAFLIMLISPIHSLLIILCLVFVYFIMTAIPALFFIFGSITYAFITMWLCLHAFQKIQRKQESK
ncbi:YesL family protein [Ornithinibacillus salinisoli]|uniref:YesL family protein n=1 Tax=Ornithinibacillus salinisoli TaxID=1848459 RepID=A0ABW4W099_9BACI